MLTVLIPTHNGLRHLQRCLPSVCRHAPPGTQVLVVDDASTDGTADWLAQHWAGVEAIRLERNQGFCGAVNAGIAAARGEVIELLNNDTEVEPGWAEAGLRHFADPTVGSVAPLVLVLDQDNVIDSAGQGYHLCGWAQAHGYRRQVQREDLQPREVFGPSASSGFYRASALRQVGGLRPEYEAYLEDTDLAFRLRWAGYRCLFEPAARVHHRGSASYGDHPHVERLLSRNEEFNFWMNLPRDRLARGLLPHLGFLAVRLVRKLLAGRTEPFLLGKLDALRHWRLILERRRQVRQLARQHGRPIDLHLSASWQVLAAGWRWLRRRQIA